ncbi:MAG: tetratricopeptide repeat protein [Candidatus Omnitrophica bacterium]|nr:tetratricopeptide repeat protein [Candidatus Omnitrophota bacterium]
MIDCSPMLLDLAPIEHWQSLLIPAQIKNSLDPGSEFAFRPVSSMTRLFLRHFFGDHVLYYHLANIFLFSVYCFLIYIFLRLLTGSATTSLYSCLFFCVHPINTIPVDYLTGHEIILFGILGILSLIAFLRYTETGSKAALGLSLLGYVLSFLTQEIMLTLPVYMAIILVLIKRYRWKDVLRVIAPYFFIGAIYVMFRLTLASPKLNYLLSQASSQSSNPLTYLGILADLVFWYVGKLFVPDNIVLIWGIRSIPFETVMRNIFISGALLICLAFLITRRRASLNFFALTWFLAGLIPVAVLCAIYPAMGFVIEPHWFFLSSLGFFILGANALVQVSRVVNKKVTGVILGGIMAALFLKTQEYHAVWKDQKTYCQYWLNVSPENSAPNFWLAEAYAAEGDYENAQRFFARAINGGPMDWGVYSNLGMIALQQKRMSLAKKYLARSMGSNPQAAPVYNNMGVVYLREHDLQEAEKYFDRAIEIDSRLVEPRLNLAETAERSGRVEKAIQIYEEILRVDPGNISGLYFLIEHNLGNDISKAEQLSRRLLNSRRNVQAATLTDVGSLFAGRNHIRLASLFYERALKTDPSYKEVYLESGKLHGNLGHWPEAISTWEAGLELDPADSRFSELIREAKRLQSQGSD